VFAKIGIKHIVRQATKRMVASRCTSAMSAFTPEIKQTLRPDRKRKTACGGLSEIQFGVLI
jgi:hypothetical protein